MTTIKQNRNSLLRTKRKDYFSIIRGFDTHVKQVQYRNLSITRSAYIVFNLLIGVGGSTINETWLFTFKIELKSDDK